MRKSIILLTISFLILASSNRLYAYGTGFQLKPGEVDLSTYWYPVSGVEFLLLIVNDEEHDLIGYKYHDVVARFDSGSPGLNSFIEIGILPWLSLGIELNFPQLIINILQSNIMSLTASVMAQIRWYESKTIGLRTRLEIEADPLFGKAYSWDKGLFNFFLIPIGATFTLYQFGEDRFALYLDSKIVTSLTNPKYRTWESAFEEELLLPPGSTQDLPHKVGPIFNFVLTPGFEFMFRGHFLFHLGFNVPLLSLSTSLLHSSIFTLPRLGLQNIEFAWRFRL
ncbi:MAG: hypothetical protein AB1798_03445 [Spirochaetota bacterium]